MNLNRKDLLNQPFTYALQLFHKNLANYSWQKKFPGGVFFRDYEHLPERSPFDIDVIMPEKYWHAFLQGMKATAEESGLVMVCQEGILGVLVMIFDPLINSKGRSWAYYEIRKTLKLSANLSITGDMIDVEYDNGLPRPTKNWDFLIYFVQAIRKGVFEQKREKFLNEIDSGKYNISWIIKKLECSESRFFEYLASNINYLVIADELRISLYQKKQPIYLPWFSKFKKYLLHKFYFINSKSIFLYTIHGPDGVGKSTVCNLVDETFSKYPISFTSFHHVTGWKYTGPGEPKSDVVVGLNEKGNKPQNKPFHRKILSYVYGELPEWVRKFWVINTGYLKYCSELNKVIMNKHNKGNVILVDRYLHDTWVKKILSKDGLSYIHYLYAYFFRKPRLAIMLTDKAENIIKRKQELSLSDINNYQKIIKNTLQRTNINNICISVEGASAEQVASLVVSDMLLNMNGDAVNLVRGYVYRQSQQK